MVYNINPKIEANGQGVRKIFASQKLRICGNYEHLPVVVHSIVTSHSEVYPLHLHVNDLRRQY